MVACRWCTHSNPLHLETCEKCNRLLPASCPLGTFSASPAKSKTQKTNARKRKKKDKGEENQRNKERKNRNKNKGERYDVANSCLSFSLLSLLIIIFYFLLPLM